jgi:hypothetical protein
MEVYMLPKDPILLVSYVNTQLRDNYPTLEEFARAEDVEASDIINTLKKVNYVYKKELNQFK